MIDAIADSGSSRPALGGLLALLLGLHPLQAMAPARASLPQSSQQATVNVIVVDGGGLDAQTLRTLRSLAMNELRRLGYAVNEDPSLEGVQPLTPDTRNRQGRTLVLRVAGRLGTKIPLAMEELGQEGATGASTSLTASSLEECDIVIPRLVEAVLRHKPAEDTARMATVTADEGRAFNKRSGEGHFILGVHKPLFTGEQNEDRSGLSLGYLYEAEHWQIGVEGLFIRSDDSYLFSPAFLSGAWIPFSGQFSPYFGLGIGYLFISEQDHSVSDGLGYKLSAGLEMFRLHRVRVQVGVDLYLPGDSKSSTQYRWENGQSVPFQLSARSTYPVMHVKVAF